MACPQVDYGGSKCKDYLYLDKFRYSEIYEVNDYKSREVRVEIRIFNRRKPSKGPKGSICLGRVNALIAVGQIFADCPFCPKDHAASPSDLILRP